MVGKTLGHYEVIGSLGAGGMGEVYRARDTRLGREVALKVLPADVADDPERLARLEREAQLLAALNHPNIATLHGLEADGDTRFLVLELVEGESLAEQLHGGALRMRRALSIGSQITAAMATAHDKGIVHRDLKPSNVLVTRDGRAKVLDFGIAKSEQPQAHDDATRQVTELTAAGTLLGTAAYMSPEQVRGQAIDKRADVWAFGCVLYETLTGVSPFARDTVADTLSAVLGQQPRWEALPPSTPAGVGRLLERCLRKEPLERLRDLGDARLAIEDALAATGPVLATHGTGGPRRPAGSSWPRAALLGSLGLGLALGLAIGAVGRWPFGDADAGASRPPVVRFGLDIELATRTGGGIAVSADGKVLAYSAADGALYLRRLADIAPVAVPGVTQARSPFFSPDGEWLGFWDSGELRKVPVAGGPPVTLAEIGIPYGATWGPDGQIVYSELFAALSIVPADGGAPRALTTLDTERGDFAHYGPSFLPGGDAVLFSVRDSRTAASHLAVADVATGQWRRLLEGGVTPHYLPTGHVVFVRVDGSLWAVRFDLASLTVTGAPFLVADTAQGASADSSQALFDLSPTGTLVTVPIEAGAATELVWVAPDGTSTTLPFEAQPYLHPRLSPDGRLAAVTISDWAGGRQDIWILDLERGTRTRLTFEGQMNRWPVWIDGGRQIVFTSTRADSPFDLYSKPADGSGGAEPLRASPNGLIAISWAEDQGALAYYEMDQFGDIWALAADGTREDVIVTPFDERSPVFSPDGRRIVYVSNESGRDEVYVRGYPGSGARQQISNDGGREPEWSPDGRAIYYRDGDRMMRVAVPEAAGLPPGAPEVLFEDDFAPGPIGRGNPNYDVAADGRLLMLRGRRGGEPDYVLVVVNWIEELLRVDPGGG